MKGYDIHMDTNKTFNQSEDKVLRYMDDIKDDEKAKLQEEEFQNTDTYKIRTIEADAKCAKTACVDKVMCDVYKNALPLSDDYKCAYSAEIDDNYKTLMNDMTDGVDTQFYVREAIKKNNRFAKHLMEEVDNLVDSEVNAKELNLDKVNKDNIKIDIDDEDNSESLDIIEKDLRVDEIAELIKNNVQNTAKSEIIRAREKKENLKAVEAELAQDEEIKTPEQVQEALELRNLHKGDYEPTLFESILLKNTEKFTEAKEHGDWVDMHTYDALHPLGFTSESVHATPDELAYIATICEYTMIEMVNVLNLEKFDKRRIADMIYENGLK